MSTVVANWAGVSNFLFCSALCGMLVSGLYVSKSECSFQNFRLQINHSCCDLRFFRALKLVSRYTCHDLDTHGSHFVHTCLMCEATAGIKRLLFFPRRTTVNCWVFSSGQQAFMYILGWSLQKARFCFRPKLSAETHLKTFILSGPLYFLYIKGASLAGLRGCHEWLWSGGLSGLKKIKAVVLLSLLHPCLDPSEDWCLAYPSLTWYFLLTPPLELFDHSPVKLPVHGPGKLLPVQVPASSPFSTPSS
jgi:hypothetical protein